MVCRRSQKVSLTAWWLISAVLAGRARHVANDGELQLLVESSYFAAYLAGNRTRQASVRKGMHTWRVFCFRRTRA